MECFLGKSQIWDVCRSASGNRGAGRTRVAAYKIRRRGTATTQETCRARGELLRANRPAGFQFLQTSADIKPNLVPGNSKGNSIPGSERIPTRICLPLS